MVIDEDVYLEHFGKKGMHWGVRKDEASDVETTSKTLEQIQARKAHNKRILRGAAVVGAAAGGVALGILLKKHGETVVTNKLRAKHPEFIDAKLKLDGKMSSRMFSLKHLASLSEPGTRTRKDADDEMAKLVDFYNARLKKMASLHGVEPSAFNKMKLTNVLSEKAKTIVKL